MNSDLLKSLIVKNHDSQERLAKYLGISLSNLNAKINGNKTSFRQNEIAAIKARYHLTSADVDSIFLTPDCLVKTKF